MPQPNYSESLVSVTNSILKEFGCETHHPGLPELDEIFADANYKNVILMVLDGLGDDLLETHLPEGAFLRTHRIRAISSVFPPTTAAAILSIGTGMTPAEHGWLGWSLYFEEEGCAVGLFSNKNMETGQIIEGPNLAQTYLPYEFLHDIITKSGMAKGHEVQNIGPKPYKNEHAMVRRLLRITRRRGRRFIYCYHYQPDMSLHFEGKESLRVAEQVAKLNAACETLGRRMKHTLLIVIADHGHATVTEDCALENFPALLATLRAPTDLDSRCIGFRVIPGSEADFLNEVRAVFGNEAIILTRDEAIASGIYGNLEPAKDYSRLRRCLADYVLLLPAGIRYWRDIESLGKHKSAHSGCEPCEMAIPLIVVESKQKARRDKQETRRE